MTIEEDVAKLKELADSTDEGADKEYPHLEADEIILKYLPLPIREQYDRVGKWYA